LTYNLLFVIIIMLSASNMIINFCYHFTVAKTVKIHLGRKALKEVLMRKHEITGKDCEIVEVLHDFCKAHGLAFKRGLSIRYLEVSENKAKVVVHIVGWPKGSSISVQLWRQSSDLWEAAGIMKVFGPVTFSSPSTLRWDFANGESGATCRVHLFPSGYSFDFH